MEHRKLIFASTLGSIFEIFDFIAFVLLSPILAQVFFPTTFKNGAIWFTYIAIAISYLLRPIGGIVLGYLGDLYGRKSIFSLSILLMSIPSLLIGLLPTYAQIGYAASFLLLFLRLFQGFSLGGEVPGSITYIAEKFKTKNYFLACSFLTFGANFAVSISSYLVKVLTEYSSLNFMLSFGWRIPFLIGSLLTIIGFYIRRSLTESEEFKQIQALKQNTQTPYWVLLQQYKTPILTGILLSIIVSLTTSIFHVFLPNLMSVYFNFNLSQTAGVSSSGAISMAIFSVIFAYLTNYIKPNTILKISLIGLLIVFGGLSQNIIHLNTVTQLYIWVIIISILLAGVNGIFFGLLAELFPTQVRFSGIGLCYNIAYILGAGITPIWTNQILSLKHNYHSIIIVCLIVSLISLINAYKLPKVRLIAR